MRQRVNFYPDLTDLLKRLRPQIAQPRNLWSGPKVEKVDLLPREILGNWMICAALNHEFGEERFTIAAEPQGSVGDGIILDKKTKIGELPTEHCLIPQNTQDKPLDILIEEAVAHKMKKGKAYAKGRTLVLFSEGNGEWLPNKVAWQIVEKHAFHQVWMVHLIGVFSGKYSYGVCLLDASQSDAPIWRIRLQRHFESWRVKRVQPASLPRSLLPLSEVGK